MRGRERSRNGHTIGAGPWCGTAGGYCNHACRCDACREAFRVKHLAYMQRNPEQVEKHRDRMRRYRAAKLLATS